MGFVLRVRVRVGGVRCADRALRVRKRRGRMRPRRGMSSLANTETGYPSIPTELCTLYSDCCINAPDAINVHSVSKRE
jgi:hypothetical protein